MRVIMQARNLARFSKKNKEKHAMKFISKKNFIPLALAGAMALGSAALCAGVPARTASAAEETQAVHTQALLQEDGIMPLSGPCIVANMETPKLVAPSYDGEHYVLVNYKVSHSCYHADKIYAYSGASERYPTRYIDAKRGETKNFVLIPSLYSNVPTPNVFVLNTYCSGCNVRSYGVNVFQQQNKREAKFNCHGSKIIGTIPTEFKQGENQWDHGGSTGNYIAFSIAYKNEVKDGFVKIPWIAYSDTFKWEVSGNTFYVRTGSDTLSIRADKSVSCNNNDTLFAFSVKTKADMKAAGIDV